MIIVVSAVGAQDEAGCRFSDVPESSLYQADIVYACEQGWFQGYPDGTFRSARQVPQHQIATVINRAFPSGSTRADLATFLRGGSSGDPTGSAGFDDVAESHLQAEDIAYAVEQGWFQGYPDGTFRPDRTITTNQIVTAVTRAFPSGSTRANLATFMRQGSQALSEPDTPSMPSSKLAYTVPVYDSSGDQIALELWVMDVDGSNARQLTVDVYYEYFFQFWELWSPNGEWIAYENTVRDPRGNASGRELWVERVDGSGARRLTDDVSNWQWSPSSDRIAYEVRAQDALKEVTYELWVAEVAGSNNRRITIELSNYGYRWQWSPKGEAIGFMVPVYDSLGDEVASELWVAGVDGSNVHHLDDDVGRWGWSLDGITYEVIVRDFRGKIIEGAEELWVVSLDGSDARQLPNDVSGRRRSPNGEHIAYIVSKQGVSELWVMDADGSNSRRLIEDFGDVDWRWSANGEWIAHGEFVHHSLGYDASKWELWVIGVDGSGIRLLNDDVGFWQWSPDEERIVFVVKIRDDVGKKVADELWMMELEDMISRQLTDDYAFEWSWSPSGEWIAFESRVWEYGKWLGTDLWIKNKDDLNGRQLDDDIQEWSWSMEEDSILYTTKIRDSSRSVIGSELWVEEITGSRVRRLITKANSLIGGFSLGSDIIYEVAVGDSSNTDQIIYEVATGESSSNAAVELWAVGWDGSGARKLADDVGPWQRQPVGDEG